MKLPITVVLAARNEEVNLPQCLAALTKMERVVLVDSGSTDSTALIAEQGGAEVVQFEYIGGYPKKRQWFLENGDIRTPWVLLLDADEVVPETLLREIQGVIDSPNASDGYLIRKGFHFLGRRFRFGGFSHAAVLLFRTGKARFEHIFDDNPGGMDMEVHERLIVDGEIATLRTHLIHEDFKGLEAYLWRHNQYSSWEAAIRLGYLRTGTWGHETIRPRLLGNAQERRRFLKQLICQLPLEHWFWFLHNYLLRLGFLEGKAGLIACRIRSQYIADVRAKVFEARTAVMFSQQNSETEDVR